MEAAATSLQGQLQIVQKPMEDLHTSQMENQDHENTLRRQFVGEMVAIRNSQALLADLVEKTQGEARAQRAANTDRKGGDVYYEYNDQGIQIRDNPGTINLVVRIRYCPFCYANLTEIRNRARGPTEQTSICLQRSIQFILQTTRLLLLG
jgi:hypothetical protein